MTHEQMERLRSALTVGGSIEAAELPAGASFLVRTAGSVVTGYHSGKVLFQGENCDRQFDWQSISWLMTNRCARALHPSRRGG